MALLLLCIVFAQSLHHLLPLERNGGDPDTSEVPSHLKRKEIAKKDKKRRKKTVMESEPVTLCIFQAELPSESPFGIHHRDSGQQPEGWSNVNHSFWGVGNLL
jgi:hypothetical protein